jgi:hypothetical protein
MWVSINGDTPSSLHGLYGKSQSKIDDLEVPPFQEPPICLLLEQLVVWSLSSFNPQSGWPWWCGEKVEKNRKLGGSKIQKLDNITIFIYFHIGNRVWKLNTPKSTGFIIIFPMKNGYCRGIPSFRQSQFKNRLARWKKKHELQMLVIATGAFKSSVFLLGFLKIPLIWEFSNVKMIFCCADKHSRYISWDGHSDIT